MFFQKRLTAKFAKYSKRFNCLIRTLNKQLLRILILGIIIRIILFLWVNQFPQNGDLKRYIDWGRISYFHGFEKTYHKEFLTFGNTPNSMPPGSLYVVSFNYNSYIGLSQTIYETLHKQSRPASRINNLLANFIFRIPSFIAEIIIFLLIYYVVSRKKPSSPVLAASLYFLNPVVIYNSTIWGQMDAINNVFFFLSIVLLTQRRFFSSVIAYFASIFIKFSLLPLIPVYLIAYFKTEAKKKNLIIYSLIAISLIIILTLPLSGKPIQWLTSLFLSTWGGELSYITNGAFNFWYMIFGSPFINKIPLESELILGIPLSFFGYFLFFLALIPIIIKLIYTNVKNYPKLFLYMSLVAFISFLLLPKQHERYLYPFFPLFATVVGFESKYVKYFLVISMIHFINLFIAWSPVALFFIPYSIINNIFFEWGLSVVLLIVCIRVYKMSLQYRH